MAASSAARARRAACSRAAAAGRRLTLTVKSGRRGPASCQRRRSRHACEHDDVADVADEPGLLGELDERRRGRARPRSGWCQRASASTPTVAPVVEVDDRLVVGHQLAAGERLAQLGLEPEPLDGAGVHVVLVGLEAALAAALGGVHGEVGVAQELLAARCPACAKAMPMLTLADTSVPSIVKVRLKELTIRSATAMTSCSVAGSSRSTANSSPPRRAAVSAARRHRWRRSVTADEQEVAGGVAEAVVDGLEVVEVEEEHREVAAAAGDPGEGVLDTVAEEALVRQVRERVVERLVRELVLEAAPLGDVAEAPHPPDDLAVDAGAASSTGRRPGRRGSGGRRGSRPPGARRARRSCRRRSRGWRAARARSRWRRRRRGWRGAPRGCATARRTGG